MCVDLVSSIEEVEVLCGEYYYDLLILDINLLGCLGIEWEEVFIDLDYCVDVIFMIGFVDFEIVISVFKLGVSDFIFKLFNFE